METNELTQMRIVLDRTQREAVRETARKLGISQNALVRDAIAIVTQTPTTLRRAPFVDALQGAHHGYADRGWRKRNLTTEKQMREEEA